MYDRFGTLGRGRRAGRRGSPRRHRRPLRELLRRGLRPARPAAGADLRLRVEPTFEEAVFGVEKEVEPSRWESCIICGRVRRRAGEAPFCVQCGGTGEMRRIQQSIFGQFVNVATCDRCKGEGSIAAPLPGVRRQRAPEAPAQDQAAIPAGVDDGTEMRAGARGRRDRGGPTETSSCSVVRPTAVLRREGIDLVYELPSTWRRPPGTERRVPTLEGEETLAIPAGTQHGRVFRIREKGVPACSARATTGWWCGWRCPGISAPASGSC